MEYYSAIKHNTFELVLMRWMNLEPVELSQVSWKEKAIIRKDTCTPTFIAALFTIAKTWKQSKCSLT